MDGAIVLTDLRNAIASDFVRLVSFIGFYSAIVDAALVLSHQNVVLFALLLSFNLVIQRSYVVLFHRLALQLSIMFLILDIIYTHADLICIMGIILLIQIFLGLFFEHLVT